MGRRMQQAGAWRAAVGVLMLYALVLQGLLGGLASARTSPETPGVICTGHVADPAQDRDGPAEHEHCCPAGCRLIPFALAAPAGAAAPVPVPTPARERRWLAARFHAPPAPIHRSARPRAPPAAA